MKKSVIGGIAVLILSALPVACGGTSSGTGGDPAEPEATGVELLCAKSTECMLGDTTEQECVTTNTSNLNLNYGIYPECAAVVEANQQTFACVGALDCDGVAAFYNDQPNHMCSQQNIGMLSDADKQSCVTAKQAAGSHP